MGSSNGLSESRCPHCGKTPIHAVLVAELLECLGVVVISTARELPYSLTADAVRSLRVSSELEEF